MDVPTTFAILVQRGLARAGVTFIEGRGRPMMRTLIAALTLLVAALIGPGLWADDQAKDKGVGQGLAERIQDLNLTDAQEAKIAEIQKEYQPKVQEAAKELAAIVKEEVGKARAVLTPDQQTKLQALKEERKERRVDGLAARIARLEQLDLTDGEIAKIEAIRKEYRPKIVKAMEGLKDILTDEQKKAREEGLKAGKKRREIIASLNLTEDQKAKVGTVGEAVGNLVKEELEKMRDVLTAEQQAKLPELKEERREGIRDRMAARIMNLKGLNLTDDQKTQLTDIRKEYRPKVHEAGNKLRAAIREEVGMIVAVLKG
jgi:Spy/CpxP family protein refolding chaperone